MIPSTITPTEELLGEHLGISFASVARIWREHDLKPWKRETFKFSPTLSWTPRSATSSACI